MFTTSIATLGKQYWFAALCGGLHLVLGMTALVIHLLGAWNDMNPTMVVALVFQFVDYPLFALAAALGDPHVTSTGDIVFVVVLGTICWTLVGVVVQWLYHALSARAGLSA